MSNEYVPGVCNIGDNEVRFRRRNTGYGGALVTVALFAILSFLDVSFIGYLILLIPAYFSAIGFLQAKKRFCIAYGHAGKYNMASHVGETQDVISSESHRKDQEYAKELSKQGFIYAGIATVALGIIGHFL